MLDSHLPWWHQSLCLSGSVKKKKKKKNNSPLTNRQTSITARKLLLLICLRADLIDISQEKLCRRNNVLHTIKCIISLTSEWSALTNLAQAKVHAQWNGLNQFIWNGLLIRYKIHINNNYTMEFKHFELSYINTNLLTRSNLMLSRDWHLTMISMHQYHRVFQWCGFWVR